MGTGPAGRWTYSQRTTLRVAAVVTAALVFVFWSSQAYLRRETRRAVRRPVRRATLRDPNISFLLAWCG